MVGRQGKKKQIPHCVRDDIAGGGAGRQPLLQGGQDVEEFVLAPAIDGEVLVQGQNIGGFKFIGQTNQAGVREIDLAVTVFSQDLLNAGGIARKLKRYLENDRSDVFEHCFWGARETSQQVTTLGNHRFASNQRGVHFVERIGTCLMKVLTAVQKRNDHAGIDQYGASPTKVPQVLFVRPQIGDAGNKFT